MISFTRPQAHLQTGLHIDPLCFLQQSNPQNLGHRSPLSPSHTQPRWGTRDPCCRMSIGRPRPVPEPQGSSEALEGRDAPAGQLPAAKPSRPFELQPGDQMVLEDDSLGKQENFASVIRAFPREPCSEEGSPGITWVCVAEFQVSLSSKWHLDTALPLRTLRGKYPS